MPLLRDLALVIALAATLAAWWTTCSRRKPLAGSERASPSCGSSASFTPGPPSSHFCLQATFGRAILARVGLGGSVASHSVLVGAAGAAGVRCPDAMARHSSARPRCDAARVNLPGRLRALLHAAA